MNYMYFETKDNKLVRLRLLYNNNYNSTKILYGADTIVTNCKLDKIFLQLQQWFHFIFFFYITNVLKHICLLLVISKIGKYEMVKSAEMVSL